MKFQRMALGLLLSSLLLLVGGLSAQDDMAEVTFTVRIENISGADTQVYSSIGIANIPVDADRRRAARPGEAFEFTVRAVPGDRLSFASMYGQSNDSFFGFGQDGIALFDADGSAISGDVSDQAVLWDAGTEVNEPLGEGPNQAPRQESPDAGEAENGTVEAVPAGDEFPAAPDVLTITLTPSGDGLVQVRIENHSDMAPVPTPISPVVYVVHNDMQPAPIFTAGEADRGLGLEQVAESGNPEVLAASLAGSAVMNVGASPGVFIIHNDMQTAPAFTSGEADRSQGLEAQAEDGNPASLHDSLMGMDYREVGLFNTPVGAEEPGALKSGDAYEFSFTAAPGDYLTITEMFGQSNDLFFAPDEHGIALFSGNGTAISGTITGLVQLWDAGTEVNQEPFVGSDQAPRQADPNTGADEGGVVLPIYAVNDGFSYPSVLSSLRVTITNDTAMEMNMMADAMLTMEASSAS